MFNNPETHPNRAESARINGATHGMYSSRVVLSNESQESYQQFKDLYIERWQPVAIFEYEQVQTMVNCRWRIRHLETIETANMDLGPLDHRTEFEAKFGNLDPRAEQALTYRVLADSEASCEKLSRHEERLQRQFDRPTASSPVATAIRPNRPPPNPSPPTDPPVLSPVLSEAFPQKLVGFFIPLILSTLLWATGRTKTLARRLNPTYDSNSRSIHTDVHHAPSFHQRPHPRCCRTTLRRPWLRSHFPPRHYFPG